MLHYHGTTETQLDQIRLTGLRPRGKRKDNYTEYPSRKDMVYLTNAYCMAYWAKESQDRMGITVEYWIRPRWKSTKTPPCGFGTGGLRLHWTSVSISTRLAVEQPYSASAAGQDSES